MMRLVGPVLRIVFALWLCVGTQIHVALDHAALFHHASHHLAEARAAGDSDATYVPHDDTLCCYHTPQHHHHDTGAPHAHLVDALLSGSAKRVLQAHDAAQLPARAVVPFAAAPPSIPVASRALAPETPAARFAALRGPPLA